MLDSSRIAELLSKEDLIFLDGWGETPYVLDKFGRQSLPIKVPSHEEELTVSDIKNQLGTPKSPVRFAIQLNAVDEVFNSAEASDVFATLSSPALKFWRLLVLC